MRRFISLDAVIPVLRQLILSELLVREARPMFRGELARKLGVSASSLQRPLQAMVKTGILRTTKQGREVLYEANSENALLPDLRSLLKKSRGVLDVVRSALEPYAESISTAFIYGSMASGSENPSSDVDLMIIGDVSLVALTPRLRTAETTLGRPVNVVIFSKKKLREMILAQNHFLSTVLDRPKLFVAGTEDDLEEASGTGTRRTPRDEPRGTRRAAIRRRSKSSGRRD